MIVELAKAAKKRGTAKEKYTPKLKIETLFYYRKSYPAPKFFFIFNIPAIA